MCFYRGTSCQISARLGAGMDRLRRGWGRRCLKFSRKPQLSRAAAFTDNKMWVMEKVFLLSPVQEEYAGV